MMLAGRPRPNLGNLGDYMVGYWVKPGNTPNDYSPVSMSNIWYPSSSNPASYCQQMTAGTPGITAASECSLPPGTGPIAGETESAWIARLAAMNWDTNKLNIWAEQVAGTLPASYTAAQGILQPDGTFLKPSAGQPALPPPASTPYTIAPTINTLTPAEQALVNNPPVYTGALTNPYVPPAIAPSSATAASPAPSSAPAIAPSFTDQLATELGGASSAASGTVGGDSSWLWIALTAGAAFLLMKGGH